MIRYTENSPLSIMVSTHMSYPPSYIAVDFESRIDASESGNENGKHPEKWSKKMQELIATDNMNYNSRASAFFYDLPGSVPFRSWNKILRRKMRNQI